MAHNGNGYSVIGLQTRPSSHSLWFWLLEEQKNLCQILVWRVFRSSNDIKLSCKALIFLSALPHLGLIWNQPEVDWKRENALRAKTSISYCIWKSLSKCMQMSFSIPVLFYENCFILNFSYLSSLLLLLLSPSGKCLSRATLIRPRGVKFGPFSSGRWQHRKKVIIEDQKGPWMLLFRESGT